MTTIAVIDYGMGNLHSVASAIEHVDPGAGVELTVDPARIARADRILFPGVGAIRDCMNELHRLELIDVVKECAASKPFLGICLGMQALLDFSEENDGTVCLGIIPGRVKHFDSDTTDQQRLERLKIPHMGWNTVHQPRHHPMWQGIADNSRFYFVHSYYVQPVDPVVTIGACHYGVDFTAAMARQNVVAVQFHPEKSQHAGLKLLGNFMKWDGTE
jgi:glutamine amidotransferase